MKKISLTAAATIVALLGVALPAAAATPFTAGQGGGARIVAGADGFGHVAWGIPSRDGAPAKIGYCRIPPGGSACDVTKEFVYPAGPGGQVPTADPLDVTIHSPSAPEVVIFGSCQSCGDGSGVDHIYRWYSTTSGAGFSPEFMLGTTPTSSGLSPGGLWLSGTNTFVSPGEGNHGLVFATAGATALDLDLLNSGYVYSPSISTVPVAGGAVNQLVYAASDLGTIQYSVFEGGYDAATVGDRSKWSFFPKSLTAPAPDSAEPQLSAGPTSMYMTYRRSIPGANQILLRRFNSATTTKAFGPSTQIQGANPIDASADAPDSIQDVSGRVHVLWSSQHDGGRLRYTQSDVSGAAFTAPVSVARGESFGDPDVAAAPSGAGWAAWSTSVDGPIRVVRLEAIPDAAPVPPPVVPPPPTVKPPAPRPLTKTVSVNGASITFGVPRACIKRGSTFKATLTWKKKKRKGNLFVKVAKADFYVGKKIVKTDRVAPFTQTLKVTATAAAGSRLTVRARAHIKVRRGKSPKKSISSSITICP